MAMEGNRLRTRAFRWRRDTVAVTSDTEWLSGESGDISHVAGTILRLRVNIQRDDPSQSLSTALGLWRSRNGGPDFQVTADSIVLNIVPSQFYAHQTPCLNLLLDAGSGTIIDSDNGMHVASDTGGRTAIFNFPAASRRFECEWCLRLDPESEFVNVDDEFEFFVKRANGDDFQFSPLQTPMLTIVAAGAIDGAGNVGQVVRGSGEIGQVVGGEGHAGAAVRGSGLVEATVQGAGYLGPAVKGSGIIRPEGS